MALISTFNGLKTEQAKTSLAVSQFVNLLNKMWTDFQLLYWFTNCIRKIFTKERVVTRKSTRTRWTPELRHAEHRGLKSISYDQRLLLVLTCLLRREKPCPVGKYPVNGLNQWQEQNHGNQQCHNPTVSIPITIYLHRGLIIVYGLKLAYTIKPCKKPKKSSSKSSIFGLESVLISLNYERMSQERKKKKITIWG